MKIHDRILQNLPPSSQKATSPQNTKDFKTILNEVLAQEGEFSAQESVAHTLNGVYELAEEVISLLERASTGDQEALTLLWPKAKELEKLSHTLDGSAKALVEELSLNLAVGAAKAEEGLI